MNSPGDKSKEKISKKEEKISLLGIVDKPIDLHYTGPDISSNGGLLLLREVENQVGLIKALSGCMVDQRDPRYVDHCHYSLLSQRIYQISAGHEDANDCDDLRTDSIVKICAGRLPQSGEALASQPTMSRFENSISRSDLYRIAECFAQNFIDSYTDEPEVIILDSDDTNYTAYGKQLEIVYNGYYGEDCFMPLHIYEGLSGKLITTILKPGRRSKATNVYAILKRVVQFIRRHWSNTLIIIRGDSHFCSPELMAWAKQAV